jgi:hypothetical protein
MSWAIYEAMAILKPFYLNRVKDLSKLDTNQTSAIKSILLQFLLGNIGCFLTNFLFISQEVETPSIYQINSVKCSHKCVNYYSYTCKALPGLYIIPSFFMITRILSVLRSSRSFDELEPEIKKLRAIIFVFFTLGSLVTGYFAKK